MPTDMAMDSRAEFTSAQAEKKRRLALAGQIPTQAGVPDSAMPPLGAHPNPLIAGLQPPALTQPPKPTLPAPGTYTPTPSTAIARDSDLGSGPIGNVPVVNPRANITPDEAMRARVRATNTRNDYRQALQGGADADTLDQYLMRVHGSEAVARAEGYQQPETTALSPREVDMGRQSLQSQADKIALASGHGLSPKPIQFSPYGSNEYERAQGGVQRGVDRFNSAQTRGQMAVDSMRAREGNAATLRNQPAQAAVAKGEADIAESQAAASKAKTAAIIAEAQRTAAVGNGQPGAPIGGTVGMELDAQQGKARAAAGAELRKVSVDPNNPTFHPVSRALDSLLGVGQDKGLLYQINQGKTLPGEGQHQQAQAADALLKQVESAWPTLDEYQRAEVQDKLQAAVPPGTTVAGESGLGKLFNLATWLTPITAIPKFMGRETAYNRDARERARVQDRVDRLKTAKTK